MFCRMTNIEVWNSTKYKIMLKIFCKVLLLFFIILTFIIWPSKLCCSSFCKQWMFVICRMTNGPWRWIWWAGSVTITMNDIWPHFNQSVGHVVVGHMTVNFVHVLGASLSFFGVCYGPWRYSQCYFCCVLFIICSDFCSVFASYWNGAGLGLNEAPGIIYCNQRLGVGVQAEQSVNGTYHAVFKIVRLE